MLPHWSDAPDLHAAAVAPVQLVEVVRLQQHVRELGVRDPGLARFEALLDRVALDHLVDREVLADVAQEVEQPHAAQPVQVVDDLRRRPLVGGEEALDLRRQPAACCRSAASLSSSLRSLDLPDGSPIIPVAPPTSGITWCPARRRWRHHHQRHQVARVQAGRRRIEADVDRERLAQHLAHVLGGRLLDETAPGKLFERAHACGLAIYHRLAGTRRGPAR